MVSLPPVTAPGTAPHFPQPLAPPSHIYRRTFRRIGA
jgi:hypothetical protein